MNQKIIDKFDELKGPMPDVVLLFRIGDYYEAFDTDADAVATVGGLPKTTIDGHRIAGFPKFRLTEYQDTLVKAGLRVAVLESLEG